MKTINITIGACMMCCLLLNCCSGSNDIIIDTVVTQFGNTNGNIQNYGGVVIKDGWMYYTNRNSYDHLYKRKMDSRKIIKLNEDHSYALNIIDDWIFYLKGNGASDATTFGGDVYRISVEGKGRKQLSLQNATGLKVTNKYIFFKAGFNGTDNNYGNLYKMDLNGNGEEVVAQDVGSFSIDDEFIYYSNFNDVDSLYKMDHNGENITKLNNEYSQRINPHGEYVYYTNHWDDGEKLFRIKNDGTQRELLSENRCKQINLHGDYIYYCNMSDNGSLYRMNLDGSEDTKLLDGQVSSINVTDDFILYHRNSGVVNGYFMANFDGRNEQKWLDR